MNPVVVSGISAVRKNIAERKKKYTGALGAALYQEAEEIIADSKKFPNFPFRDGNLRDSDFVGLDKGHKGPYAVLGFGVAYARRQHEEHATGSQYLKVPFDAAIAGFSDRLGRRVIANLAAKISMTSKTYSTGEFGT